MLLIDRFHCLLGSIVMDLFSFIIDTLSVKKTSLAPSIYEILKKSHPAIVYAENFSSSFTLLLLFSSVLYFEFHYLQFIKNYNLLKTTTLQEL